MSKRLFKTMVALLAIAAAATGPARAQSNTVTWNNYTMSEFNLSSQGDRQTSDDVTLTSNGGSVGDNDGNIYFNGAFTFSVPAGSVFTQIVIRDDTWLGVDDNNTGWSRDEYQTQATWTGSARSVACQINASHVQYIEFTIAPAVPQMYTSEVSITDLVPGDTLAEGATIIGSGDDVDMVFINAGRTKENGVVQSYWTDLYEPPTVIGTNGTISRTNTYTPVDGNGRDGNAWVVTSADLNYNDGFDVGLGGIIIQVYRTLDSIPADWTVKVAGVTQTLQTYDGGNPKMRWLKIVEHDSVTLVPAGNPRRVKSVTLEEVVSLAPPLTMEALTAGTIVVNGPKSGMQYSLNGGTKTAMNATTTITVAAGDKVAFYGNGNSITQYYTSFSNYTKIAGGTAQVKVYGNIMSLVDEENFATGTTLSSNNAFRGLFDGNGSLTDASGLLLPATTLTEACYGDMFYGCTALTAAPELPATTLATYCYQGMFYGCTALTAAPALPATTLASYCYNSMFGNCYALTAAPELPATTLAQGCYYYMFYSCTALTAAPELPATTLAESCYNYMFQNCSALTAAPELPATALALSCYGYMFNGCSSLATGPTLPAATLVQQCYTNMFNGCSNLSSVTCLATDISASSCLNNWLQGAGTNVNGTKTFTAAAETEWPSGVSGILEGWTRLNPDGSEWVAPNPMLSIPLTLEATTAGTIVVNMDEGSLTMKYSKNGGAKTTITATTTITVAAGDKVAFYGNGTSTTAYGNGPEVSLKGTAKTKVYGNIMSLVDETGYATARTLSGSYVFYGLFMNNTKLTDASGLLLPATTLAKACYSKMFYGCTTLTAAPELPATTLADFCYASMFSGCNALETAPALPATTLVKNSYAQMFYNCSKLSSVTCLATSISAGNCLYQWLQGAGSSAATKTLHVKASMGSASWNNGSFTVTPDQP